MGRERHIRTSSGVKRRRPSHPRIRAAAALLAAAGFVVGTILVTQAGAVTAASVISVADVSTPEGGPEGVDHFVSVPVTLSAPSPDVVTVEWTTIDGTAGPADYSAASGVVTFVPGDTSETIDVLIDGGGSPEWNEYFSIFLRNPNNATIGRAFAKVVIVNDDGDPPGVPPGDVNVAPAGGDGQCVALKNGAGCRPLDEAQLIDLEDIAYINPRGGRVQLTAPAGAGAFYGGRFSLKDIAVSETVSRPILVVRLAGGSFKQCKTGNRSLAAKGKPIRRLWGKGKGRFRTRGRYSSGTVRGTSWITEDFCDGTRTRVFVGVVRVYDLVTKKWVVLKAGQSYFAKAGPIS